MHYWKEKRKGAGGGGAGKERGWRERDWRGRGWREGVWRSGGGGWSQTTYKLSRRYKLGKIHLRTWKLLIFIVSSMEPHYVCFLWHCHWAVPCIFQKKTKTEMISTRLDNSNNFHPCKLARKEGRGAWKGRVWVEGLKGEGLEGIGGHIQHINKAEERKIYLHESCWSSLFLLLIHLTSAFADTVMGQCPAYSKKKQRQKWLVQG